MLASNNQTIKIYGKFKWLFLHTHSIKYVDYLWSQFRVVKMHNFFLYLHYLSRSLSGHARLWAVPEVRVCQALFCDSSSSNTLFRWKWREKREKQTPLPWRCADLCWIYLFNIVKMSSNRSLPYTNYICSSHCKHTHLRWWRNFYIY